MTCVVVTGGVAIFEIDQNVNVTANTFLSNSASSMGGAVFTESIDGTVTTNPNTFGTGREENLPDDVSPAPPP